MKKPKCVECGKRKDSWLCRNEGTLTFNGIKLKTGWTCLDCGYSLGMVR